MSAHSRIRTLLNYYCRRHQDYSCYSHNHYCSCQFSQQSRSLSGFMLVEGNNSKNIDAHRDGANKYNMSNISVFNAAVNDNYNRAAVIKKNVMQIRRSSSIKKNKENSGESLNSDNDKNETDTNPTDENVRTTSLAEEERIYMENLRSIRSKPTISARNTKSNSDGNDGHKNVNSESIIGNTSDGEVRSKAENLNFDSSSSFPLSSFQFHPAPAVHFSDMVFRYVRQGAHTMFEQVIQQHVDKSFCIDTFMRGASHAVDTVVNLSGEYSMRKSNIGEGGRGATEAEATAGGDKRDTELEGLLSPLGVAAIKEMHADYVKENLTRVFAYEGTDAIRDVALHEGGMATRETMDHFLNIRNGGGWRTEEQMRGRDKQTSVSMYHAKMADETMKKLEIEPLPHADFSNSLVSLTVHDMYCNTCS